MQPTKKSGIASLDSVKLATEATPKERRLRQDHKPLMNKLEAGWYGYLKATVTGTIRPQAIRLRLANGSWYKPDHSAVVEREGEPGRLTFWECKGPHVFKSAFETLKRAAAEYPEFRFILVWRAETGWKTQEILP